MPLRYAIICLSLLLIYPQDSLAAARDAFALWQQTVAPSLLPFFALIPALTCPEATACFARLLRLPCRLLGIPQDFAGAVGVAVAAGSPAGVKALVRIAARASYPADGLFRAAMLCAGVSPGFLISGVGAGMLDNPSAGMVLLIAQLLALITSSCLLRLAALPSQSISLSADAQAADAPPVLYAANGVLAILVWMVIFAAGTRILQRLLPAAAPLIPFAAEFSAGCAHAASLKAPLWASAAVIGFGGVCAGCQNLSALKPVGIPARLYFTVKIMHAALCALYAFAMENVPLPAISFAPQHILPTLIVACLLPIFHKIVTPAAK